MTRCKPKKKALMMNTKPMIDCRDSIVLLLDYKSPKLDLSSKIPPSSVLENCINLITV